MKTCQCDRSAKFVINEPLALKAVLGRQYCIMIFRKLLPFALVASVALPSTGQAAPQVLAVMASLSPQPVLCGSAVCTTSFTSYCLQRERDVPTTGQAYIPTHEKAFTLIITRKDGSEVKVPAMQNVAFASARGYSSVRVMVPRDVITAHDGVSATIVAAAGASLVPEPVAGDPNPITEAEIAFATKSLREHGQDIVDATPDAKAAQIVNRIAATIIPKMPASNEALEELWHNAIDGLGPVRPASADAIEKARGIYDWCKDRSSYHSMGGVKSCLEFKHDDTIMKLNSDYWESQPGY